MMKKLVRAITLSEKNASINFIFDVSIDIPRMKVPIGVGENWSYKIAVGGHFEKKRSL